MANRIIAQGGEGGNYVGGCQHRTGQQDETVCLVGETIVSRGKQEA